MAPEFDMDMGEVEYKPPLPNNQYTLRVSKCNLLQAKTPNKRTGKQEWMFSCELVPLEPEFTEYIIYHNWSLTVAAMQVEDAVMSLKKMYEAMGESEGTKPNTDVVQSWTFIGETTLKPNNSGRLTPNLTKVIKRVE